METSICRIPILTAVQVNGRNLHRMVQLDVRISSGTGRIWFDISAQRRVGLAWQEHLYNLLLQGQKHFDLPWLQSDLWLSFTGSSVAVDGWSASLPLFVAWLSLLSSRPLPASFLATGCAVPNEVRLAPAPLELLQGKLELAQAFASSRSELGTPLPVWVPAGSGYQADRLPALDVQEVGSLLDAAERILALPAGVRSPETGPSVHQQTAGDTHAGPASKSIFPVVTP